MLTKIGYKPLSPTLVAVVFALFDANGDGVLDQSEFMDVMHDRATHGLDKVLTCFENNFGVDFYIRCCMLW